jgi:hypothetical protein
VQAAEVGHHHDVVEVRDDEIRVVDVDIQADGGEEQSGQAADREQADEPDCVEHRRLP